MYTHIDEGRGTVRCQWTEVRERVAKVEPCFSAIVDELAPDDNLPLYLVYLPYGSLKGDHISSFLPDVQENFWRLTDKSLPKILHQDLGYGENSSPFGLVLTKELEYFIELEQEDLIIPSQIHQPGAFFNSAILLNDKKTRTYAPNGILKASSGCRSVFMLPNIGCMTHHLNLQKDLNIHLPAPKRSKDHWEIFKAIAKSPELKSNWRTCLLYFSSAWLSKISNDSSWLPLKLYLLEKERKNSAYQRFIHYYDMIFSLVQKNKNLKPNPYLMDTARHLFNITLGLFPGFVPAEDDNSLPLSLLQHVYINSYGLNKYYPTIMKAHRYHFETELQPIYYSLQHPTTYAFSPKSRNESSVLSELRELMHILSIFTQELAKEQGLCKGTVFEMIANQVKFSCFHNKKDSHQWIQTSSYIAKEDSRFSFRANPNFLPKARFSADAKFLRGCIRIGKN